MRVLTLYTNSILVAAGAAGDPPAFLPPGSRLPSAEPPRAP